MSRCHTTAIVLVAGTLAGCVGSRRGFDGLRVGMRVAAKGRPGTGTATRIRELAPGATPRPDKFEVTAPVAAASRDAVEVIGRRLGVSSKTSYENADRSETRPFIPSPGDWLKIKGRTKPADGVVARMLRKSAARDHFTLEGYVTGLDAEHDRIEIATIPVIAPAGTKVTLLAGDQGSTDPLALFLEDDQKSVPFSVHVSDRVWLGGGLSVKLAADDEFDFDRTKKKDRTSLRVDANLDLLWRFDDAGSFAFLEGKVGRRDRFKDGSPDDLQTSESVSRAYAYVRLTDTLRLIAGRQDFDEEREWLWDEVLDGVRLRWTAGAFDFDAAAAFGREILDETNETQDTQTFIGMARYHVTDKHAVSAYVVQRKDSDILNFEPLHVGLRSFSKRWTGFGHWAELSHASGYSGRRRIEGIAADLGVTYRFDAAIRPSITLGWAFASGKSAASGELGFRQTGLQDNNARFGGVTSFRYYGEVLEPELANMTITTLGFGVRPVNSFSVDALLHGYRQDVARAGLAGSQLKATPTGGSRDLGWEADLVVGYRDDTTNLEFIFGRFEPGTAFTGRDAAHRIQLQMRLRF